MKALRNILRPRAPAAETARLAAMPLIDAETRRHYVAEDVAKVDGWNGCGAFDFLNSIDEIQRTRLGITGALAEIGVHHGQFFIYLAMLRAPGERALACDVFERQEMNRDHSGSGDRGIFEHNLRQYVGSLAGITILAQSSEELTRDQIIGAVGPVRILSIDGGHWRDIVVNDLCIAASCLEENGIVVLDDVFDMYWPGVSEGLTAYLLGAYDRARLNAGRPADKRLVPFAVGCNKTLLCFEDKYQEWITLFEELGPQDALKAKQLGWEERPVLIYDFEIPAEELSEALQAETSRREEAEAALQAAGKVIARYLDAASERE